MNYWIRLLALLVAVVPLAQVRAGSTQPEDEIALALANMLRAGRTVIASNQALINDPGTGKDLTGAKVRDAAIKVFRDRTGNDPDAIISKNPYGKLLSIQIESITEVLDDNQTTINKPGIDFKGFVPAVFGRLVNERFREKIGREADVKVTAPVSLVRNRKALPDEWENSIIKSKFLSGDWPKDKVYSELVETGGRTAYRVLVPEYYNQSCMSCHGEPKGEIDVTGYPKEGGVVGQLGGVISISLFR